MESVLNSMARKYDRREFLKRSHKIAAGLAIGTGLSGVIATLFSKFAGCTPENYEVVFDGEIDGKRIKYSMAGPNNEKISIYSGKELEKIIIDGDSSGKVGDTKDDYYTEFLGNYQEVMYAFDFIQVNGKRTPNAGLSKEQIKEREKKFEEATHIFNFYKTRIEEKLNIEKNHQYKNTKYIDLKKV